MPTDLSGQNSTQIVPAVVDGSGRAFVALGVSRSIIAVEGSAFRRSFARLRDVSRVPLWWCLRRVDELYFTQFILVSLDEVFSRYSLLVSAYLVAL